MPLSFFRSVSPPRGVATSVKWDCEDIRTGSRPTQAPLGTTVGMTCATNVRHRKMSKQICRALPRSEAPLGSTSEAPTWVSDQGDLLLTWVGPCVLGTFGGSDMTGSW